MENMFKDNLIVMRKANLLTQLELSEKLGLRRATISTYERGDNTPKLDTLLKMRDLFGISIDDMVSVRLGVEIQYRAIKDGSGGNNSDTSTSNCTIHRVIKRVCIICGKQLKQHHVPPTCSTKCSKEYFKQT